MGKIRSEQALCCTAATPAQANGLKTIRETDLDPIKLSCWIGNLVVRRQQTSRLLDWFFYPLLGPIVRASEAAYPLCSTKQIFKGVS